MMPQLSLKHLSLNGHHSSATGPPVCSRNLCSLPQGGDPAGQGVPAALQDRHLYSKVILPSSTPYTLFAQAPSS